jgi:ABC-type branched-subunit amino acid transport system substrate-binding protein
LNADRYRLLARVAADEGSARAEVRDLVRKAVHHAAGDPLLEARVKRALADLLTEEQASGLAAEGREMTEQAVLEAAREALRTRDFARAGELALKLRETWPETAHQKELHYLARRAEAGDPAIGGRVGLLLPLSGEYAGPSERLKQVIDLAADGLGGQIEVLAADTAADPARAIAEAERLVLDEGCVALLGPLLKEEVGPVALVAQAIGVPLVALSQAEDPTSVGDYVFRAFLPIEEQVDALLDHAVGVAGFDSFAILYPENPYGEAARDAFAAGAESRGAHVARVVPYDPEASNFLAAARELGQKDLKARAGELWRARREAQSTGMDPENATVDPVVDYDAIFLPDSHLRIPLVASALAYEEFAVGAFRPRRGEEPMPLLGLNAWNHPDLPRTGGRPVRGSRFVDAFLATRDDPAVKAFVEDYTAAFSRQPGVLDAMAHDATRLLAAGVIAGGTDRTAVRDSLALALLPDAVAGGARFRPDREMDRKLLVLTIDENGIREWTPEPPPEPAEPEP